MIARFKKSSYRWSVPAVILLAVLGCVVLTNAQGTSQTKSREEFEKIVEDAVLTISTCAETDPRVGAALESLQELDDNTVVKEVAKFLDSDKNTIRRSAIYILWRGNFKSIEPAVSSLQKLCSHEEEYTRGMAALALGERKVNSSFETLCDMTLEDSSSYARRCAAYALGLMGRAEAKPILEQALKDSDFNVRNNAEAALTMLSQTEPEKSQQRHFVRLVVDKNSMTFEGKPIENLEQLPTVLAMVPNRKQTVFEVAVTSMDIKINKDWGQTMNLLASWSSQYGFDYLSFIGVHPLGSYGVSDSRFNERLHNSVTIDIEHSPKNKSLTVQYAVIAICKDAGIPYQWEKSAQLADPERRGYIEPVHIKNVMLEKALLDVLNPIGLRYDLDENGLYLYRPTNQRALKGYQNSKSMVQIVTFRPKDGFSPRTAKDILDRFNNCVKFRVNTHHFRTEIREGKLYGSILTDSSAEGKALELMLNQCNELEFVNSKAADEQELAEHYAKGSPGLKTTESSRAVKFKNPQVVSTSPVAFANNVSASLKRIKVTFDQPMMDGSWSWTGGGETFPKTTGKPRYNSSKTTCSLPVNLKPGKVYWVGINSPKYKNFQTAEGVPAVPYVILFATRGTDGKATPIPRDMLTKAKRINARAGKMSSQPKKKATTEVAEPYTQIMFNDIGNDGTISFKSTIRKISRDVNPVKTTSFVNSDFVNVTSMSDNKGRPIKFTTKHKGSHYRYNLTFNEPVLPGETMVYASEGTMTGLIKPVVGSKDTFQYFMTHWPAAGQPTRRIETYLLPEGAELISTTPEDMERRTKNGRIELHQEKTIPAGGSITTAFQYILPVGKGGEG